MTWFTLRDGRRAACAIDANAAQAVVLVTVEDLAARALVSDRQRAMPLAS